MSGGDLVWELTLDELASQYKSRTISPVEVMDCLLDRIDRWQRSLNCFLERDVDRARGDAMRATELLARGVEVPALVGVPIAVKDNIDVAGWRTTGGSTIVPRNPRSSSATVIENLRRQGAVIVGKTNMYELAYGDVNAEFGEVRNPWNLDRNCSASSSGSACAVAARLAFGSLGTDTGGSVRLPAAACGVVGVKPSRDLLSLRGVLTVSGSLDVVGPLARTVLDASLLLEAMSGEGPFCVDREDLELGSRGLTVGVPRVQSSEKIGEEVRQELERCGALLEQEGARVVDIDTPSHLLAREVMWTVSGAEMAERWGSEVLQGRGVSSGVRSIVGDALLIRAVDYLRAQRVRAYLSTEYERILRNVDVVMMPVAPGPASALVDGAVDAGDLGESYMASLTRYCPVANVCGLPAVSVPTTTNREGLPLSVQFVSGCGREALALRAARALERVTPGFSSMIPSGLVGEGR